MKLAVTTTTLVLKALVFTHFVAWSMAIGMCQFLVECPTCLIRPMKSNSHFIKARLNRYKSD
jgi:hypothetical protein